MRQAGQACAAGRKARPAGPHAAVAWRKARSAMPHAAAAERPGGAGNIFAPCVISGSSTRKRALGGKIRAPCILNRPIAPGNGCIGRGCCHLDLEKHAFRADVARKGAFFAHSAKRDAYGAVLASQGPGAAATRGERWGGVTRMSAHGGRDRGDAPGAARRRWRRSGRRARARAVGRIRGRGARGIVGLVGRAAARGRDGGGGMADALGAGNSGPELGWSWSGPRRCRQACIG